VAEHLGVSWDLIKDIVKRDLARRFAKPKLKHLRPIAIDEIAVAKGHRYLTIVLNRETGAVVFVGDGKGADALKPFWKRFRGSQAKAKIQAVAMDLSPAYGQAVRTHLPEAKIVFDRFPVIKLFNEKLTALRRALYHEVTDLMAKQVLKGSRWLLLKSAENLDDKKDEKRKLEEALALNQPLAVAYSLRPTPSRRSCGSSGNSPARSWRLCSSTAESSVRRPRGSRSSRGSPRPWRRTGAGC
jgi:transposase